jgi:indole-3-glycerol phosphate synthase
MTILDEIIRNKWEEVRAARQQTPLEALKTRTDDIRDFRGALSGDGISVIAEIKKKSPSKGEIQMSADPVDIAQSYEQHGAAAISVLTDEEYFGGSLDFLRQIRAEVSIPILRKDFIIDEYQVWESYHAGADAILIILDAVVTETAIRLHGVARELGLHVLVESYTEESLGNAHRLEPEIVGINARDLTSMTLDLDAMIEKSRSLPHRIIKVAESGIIEPAHLAKVAEAGFDAALIGTAFMQTESPGKTLGEYLEYVRTGELKA